MRWRPMLTVLGAAMAGSYFLPWIVTPLAALSPRDGFGALDWSQIANAPPAMLAFLASFALPALLALISLIGWTPRLLTLLSGLLPVGLVAWLWFGARDRIAALGLPAPKGGDLAGLWGQLQDIAGLGLYVYAGAALLLLVIGMFDAN